MHQTPDPESHGQRVTLAPALSIWPCWSKKGEIGLPSVLTAKTWGFYDVLFKVKRQLSRNSQILGKD